MSTLVRYALMIGVAALFVGCGGLQPPTAPPGLLSQSGALPLQRTSAAAVRSTDDASWMAPNAASQDLLYVTNYSYVSVYSYPQGKLVGALTGFNSTVGDCVDNKGNVFITNHIYRHGVRIAEYVHGGTKPIAELATKHVGNLGCSIDPTTGSLAVSGGGSGTYGGGVDIFKLAKGKPSYIMVPQMVFTSFCGYDATGNLFVDGSKDFSGDAAFAELPKGSRKFIDIQLNAIIDSSGGVQWDGKHVAVGAYIPHKSGKSTPVIYRFAIAGTQGQKVGTSVLGSPAYLTSFQFFISQGIVIVPNWYYMSSVEKTDVLFYKYPAGGSPILALTKDVTAPRGVTISRVSQSQAVR